MDFTASSTPIGTAHTYARLETLREILRLPDNLSIVAIVMDPDRPMHCRIELRGPLPAGELIADYSWESQPVLKFKGWK